MAAMTKEELKKEFLDSVKLIARRSAMESSTIEEACESLVHSLLVMIDGVGSYSSIPSPLTIVVTAEDPDEIRNRVEENGEDYDTKYVSQDTPINDDCYLHDELYPWDLVPRNFFPGIIQHYRDLVKEKGDLLPTEGNPEATKEHLLGMLDTLDNKLDQRYSKKHRWLGYIQGVVCAFGLTTVTAERDFTRNIFRGQ